jgi:6-phosphogluconolactonase
MQARRIEIFPSAEVLAEKAAGYVAQTIARSLQKQARFSFVLSGGSTPKRLYEILATEYHDKIPWDKLLIFFGDERCVAPDDAQSNYKMAYDALLSKVPILAENIFRLKGEIEPEKAAAEYEATIKSVLGEQPDFDLALLGLGADGHTASLFPGSGALNETEKLVAAARVERLGASRLTLTLPVFNLYSASILFMVAGAGKAEAVRKIFTETAESLPAQLVSPNDGNVTWFLDQDAASLLDKTVIEKFT